MNLKEQIKNITENIAKLEEQKESKQKLLKRVSCLKKWYFNHQEPDSETSNVEKIELPFGPILLDVYLHGDVYEGGRDNVYLALDHEMYFDQKQLFGSREECVEDAVKQITESLEKHKELLNKVSEQK
jgi:hypothetical protein